MYTYLEYSLEKTHFNFCRTPRRLILWSSASPGTSWVEPLAALRMERRTTCGGSLDDFASEFGSHDSPKNF